MSTLHKIVIRSPLLVLLLAGVRPAYSGSATSGETIPAPATPRVVRPSAGVAAVPPAATIRPSAPQSVATARALLAPDPKAAAPVLVIPAREMTPETYGRIVEDLSIMSRIIEKSLREGSEDLYGLTTGILYLKSDLVEPVFLGPGGTGPQILRASGGRPKAIYVGGYGAVFSFQVAFPLVPPPEAAEPNQAADETDRTWAQARQELLDPQAARRTQKDTPPQRPYSAEAVENLRRTLIGLLQHATNIRELGPEDFLTILVQGPATGGPRPAAEATLAQQLAALPRVPDEGRTLLTLRARKADIDQLAKGRLDETQFQQRVQITTY